MKKYWFLFLLLLTGIFGMQAQTATQSSVDGNISSEDAFIRVIVSKTEVKLQEVFIVTFRLYTMLNIINFGSVKFPDFEGFVSRDVELPISQLQEENYNGRIYNAVDLKKNVLVSPRSGKKVISGGAIEVVFEVASGRKVQTFFGLQDVMVEVRKVLEIVPVTIDVSLP